MSFLLDEEKTWLQRDFGLDRRLIKALQKLSFVYPTLVQSKCIPLALQGADILIKSRTGSGKTVAFSLPVLQKVLKQKESSSSNNGTKAIILAPTKELVKQIKAHLDSLNHYCQDVITIYALNDDSVSASKLHSDILVTTPGKLVAQMKDKKIPADLSHVHTLVIDEADLVLSFGYLQDVEEISQKRKWQHILTSATLSPELDKFKRLNLVKPAIIKLEEPQGVGHLLQFYLEATEQEKFLIIYVFIKLGLLQGKGLIFVNDVNKCYRLKLFFQQFFISAAVLNAEIPLNSRIHILEEYNRGVFDYLIATDACIDQGEADEQSDEDSDEEDNEGGEEDEESEDEEQEGAKKKGKKPAKKDAKKKQSKKPQLESDGYGVSRGIDFQGVNFVINFDFPVTSAAYTHRIGRTARGTSSGTSLSFVTKFDPTHSESAEAEVARRDHEVLAQVRSQQPRLGIVEGDNVLNAISTLEDNSLGEESRMQPAPLLFNMSELENFRYRVEDTLRSVTMAAVRELRSAEIKNEILNSEKLKNFFAENPNDLKVLKHDKAIAHPIQTKEHLQFVPQYLIPASMRSVASVVQKKGKRRKRKNDTTTSQEQRIKKSKMNDPLMNLESGNNGGNDNDDGGDEGEGDYEEGEEVSGDMNAGGMSGRKDWKERHKKGKFNPIHAKKNQHRQEGSFIKSKNYK